MGQLIVKVSPDEDAYFAWNTVVDAPVSGVLSRAEMEEWLVRDAMESARISAETGAALRFEWADASGTSAAFPREGHPATWAWGEKESWQNDRPEGVPDEPLDRAEVARLLREEG